MWDQSGSSATCIVGISGRTCDRVISIRSLSLIGSCPKHVLHPDVARARIDTCYLDTTYLNPKYCFPPQPQVIQACAILARKIALGISPNAPSLEDLKPEIKPFIKAEPGGGNGYTDGDGDVMAEEDIKPNFELAIDRHAVEVEREERSKAMMSGWLVKRESEDELGMKVKKEDGEEEDDKGDVLREMKAEDNKPVKPKGRTLIVMGTYSIGKERIVKGGLPHSLCQAEIELNEYGSRGESIRHHNILRP
jgi:DNA cross-link repair 1A protein